MKLDKFGASLSLIYVAIAAVLFAIAYTTADVKGRFVLGQLAVMPAVLLADALGLNDWLSAHSWANSHATAFIVSVMLFYLAG